MADKISLRLEGSKRIQRKLDRIADHEMRDVLEAGVEELKDTIGKYPSQPEPQNPDYRYRRGQGTEYVPTGRINKTSENLRHGFEIQSSSTRAILKNVASYASYVIGELQTALHKATGWNKASDVAQDKADDLARKILNELTRIWGE